MYSPGAAAVIHHIAKEYVLWGIGAEFGLHRDGPFHIFQVFIKGSWAVGRADRARELSFSLMILRAATEDPFKKPPRSRRVSFASKYASLSLPRQGPR